MAGQLFEYKSNIIRVRREFGGREERTVLFGRGMKMGKI